jgi:hypothetical protein
MRLTAVLEGSMPFPSWIIESDAWLTNVIYLLTDELRFVDCNPVWDMFAAENGGLGISRQQIRGRLILDYVPDVLRTFYVHKYWFASRASGWTHFDYDCSSPEKIRLFRMAMMPIGDRMLVSNHLRVEEECEVKPPLTAEQAGLYISSTGMAVMCANCRKTRHFDSETQGDWIPEMLRRDGLKITHSLCPRCSVHLYG